MSSIMRRRNGLITWSVMGRLASENHGDPLNIVIVGRGLDALFSFTVREWLVRCMFSDVSRKPRFKRRANNISLRNHLRLWLAPFTIGGQQV
jgi:hypothetical protein